MPRPPANLPLRLFVAVYPPAEVTAALGGALAALEPAECRMTPAEQVHMTLQFIGDVRARDVEGVVESVSRSAAGVRRFELRPERLISIPAKGPARLIAATMNAPGELLEITRRLAQRLSRTRRADPVEGFLPHMTLCRFREGARPGFVDVPVEGPAFEVNEVVLVKSALRPGGAVHTGVERFGLE
ncbi:MAG: RNA 2',3'-cyclic phosphodiesterase [Phycisphaerales bacterium]|nr:RNA 2',3'-cyclic phosphodiesterase [Phycisphaerales bacterium]